MIKRFARWRMYRCKLRAEYARRQFDAAWTGADMNEWERVDARAWRRYAFWEKFA